MLVTYCSCNGRTVVLRWYECELACVDLFIGAWATKASGCEAVLRILLGDGMADSTNVGCKGSPSAAVLALGSWPQFPNPELQKRVETQRNPACAPLWYT